MERHYNEGDSRYKQLIDQFIAGYYEGRPINTMENIEVDAVWDELIESIFADPEATAYAEMVLKPYYEKVFGES